MEGELSYVIWKYLSLPEPLVIFYMSEIISCVEYMHSLGIYHRDLKPENVLIHSDGHIRLTDFGTAKMTNNGEGKEKEKEKENNQSEKPSEAGDPPQTREFCVLSVFPLFCVYFFLLRCVA